VLDALLRAHFQSHPWGEICRLRKNAQRIPFMMMMNRSPDAVPGCWRRGVLSLRNFGRGRRRSDENAGTALA
jgi:hypothetical protein